MKWIIPFFLLLLVMPVLAETDSTALVQELGQQVLGKELPSFLVPQFGSQRMNIHVAMESGDEVTVALLTEKGKVKSIALAEVKDPTLEISAPGAALNTILQAENQGQALWDALQEKKITYQALGWQNKIRMWLTTSTLKVKQLFKEESIASSEIVDKNVLNQPDADITGAVVAPPVEEESIIIENKTEPIDDSHHLVNLIDGGFEMPELKIRAGDTVEWKNIRKNPTYSKAMVIGTMKCARVRSTIFDSGKSFAWTFNDKGSCLIVDGIYTTQTMKIIVE